MSEFEAFLNLIEAAEKRIGASNGAAWYRGQSNNWDLKPSLMRHYDDHGVTPELPVDPREEGFFNEFLFRSPKLSLKSISSWELLALMQHYRVPTRLLDWTENLLVACYFAICDYAPHRAIGIDNWRPCIYVANPYKITRAAVQTANKGVPLVHRNDGLRLVEITALPRLDYAATFIETAKWWFKSPLPIASPWQNPRLTAQQGFFTVHGLNWKPLNKENGASKYIKCVYISKGATEEIRRVLKAANINHYTLFQDYESLAKLLRSKFK